jgi:hypothetical protein
LAAPQHGLAVLAVGGLVHLDRRAAVGAVAFEQAGLVRPGLGATAAEERPDFGKRLVQRRQDLAVLKVYLAVEGRRENSHGQLVEMIVALGVGEGDRFDGDVVHRVPVAQRLLLVELEAEALVDGVGDEGADGGQVLAAPGELDFLEGGGDALLERLLVEGAVFGAQQGEDRPAVVLVGTGARLGDDARLPGALALASGVPEEADDQGEQGEADVGVVVAEAAKLEDEPEEVEEVASAASSATGSPTATTRIGLAATRAGEEERRDKQDG